MQFKILRNAYEPLPPTFSRPFQALVNTMLRADPDDRPTTQVRAGASSKQAGVEWGVQAAGIVRWRSALGRCPHAVLVLRRRASLGTPTDVCMCGPAWVHVWARTCACRTLPTYIFM